MDHGRTDELRLPDDIERLVVLGDPHGDLAGLEVVLAHEDRPGTAFVSVGDNIGYADGQASSEFWRILAARAIASVMGNHEAYSAFQGGDMLVGEGKLTLPALDWSRALPYRLRARVAGLEVSVVHSLENDYVKSSNAAVLADEEGVDVVFCGHSHAPEIHVIGSHREVETRRPELEPDEVVEARILEGVRYVVNAGSLAVPGFDPEPGRRDLATYAVLDARSRLVSVRVLAKRGDRNVDDGTSLKSERL